MKKSPRDRYGTRYELALPIQKRATMALFRRILDRDFAEFKQRLLDRPVDWTPENPDA